jgi:hypothetical protein
MTLAALLCGAVTVVAGATAADEPTGAVPQRFSATAINMGNLRGPTTVNRLEIVVDRWSPSTQRERLIGVLFEKGPEKLLDTLKELPRVGYIRTPDSLGYDLHYAQLTPLPDRGERIVLATDRYIRFWEIANQTRSAD